MVHRTSRSASIFIVIGAAGGVLFGSNARAGSGLAASVSAPEGAPSRAGAEHAPESPSLDPTSGQPFRWHEILRLDLRPNSPVTRRSVVVAPASPLPLFGDDDRVAILATYRSDQLTEDVGAGLAGRTLHRFELGFPSSFRLGDRWALDLDPRIAFGGDLGGSALGVWYPWIRGGVSWRATEDLILGASVLFTRGPLGLIPVPLFSMYWRPRHSPFRIDALAPRYVETAVRVRRVELFYAFHWETTVWGVDREEGSNEELLIRQEMRLHAGVRVCVWGPLGLEAAAQWVPWQQRELERGRTTSFGRPEDVAATLSIVLDKLSGDSSAR